MLIYTKAIIGLLATTFLSNVASKNPRRLKVTKGNGKKPKGNGKPKPIVGDYSWAEGTWYECLETSLMTFTGDVAPKHINENVECSGKEFGNIAKVGNHSKIYQLTHMMLNHCQMWKFSKETCPNQTLPNHNRGDEGNVIIMQQAEGIGSYALGTKTIKFYSDFVKVSNGTHFHTRAEHATEEDMDTYECHMGSTSNSMVCDVHHYEARWSSWSPPNSDSFKYQDFGSYSLVKDLKDCKMCKK